LFPQGQLTGVKARCAVYMLRGVIDQDYPLVLGSKSPRRREMLQTLGIPLRVVPADVDERLLTAERPAWYLERIVADKYRAAAAASQGIDLGALLVADTIVLLDAEILGKPASESEAEGMLSRLSGRSHEVWTRFAVGCPVGGKGEALHAETVSSTVSFRRLLPDEIRGYAKSGEGLDKAGAYAVQGLGSFAVARIEGSYSNVVGLPVCEVVLALRRTGLLGRFP
jgi:septum formation protein